MKNIKKYLIHLLIIILISININAFAGGDGSSGNPYQIINCTELQSMGDNLTAYYLLNNNIDCSATTTWNSGSGFLPVGDDVNKFEGSFDGDNYKISDIYINRTLTSYLGLFGWIDSGDKSFTDVTIESMTIYGSGNLGAFSGRIYNSYINNINVTKSNINGAGYVGGFAGLCFTGCVINNSNSQVSIVATTPSGGFTARNDGKIYNSKSDSNVTCTTQCGGFVGFQYNGLTENSYSLGKLNCSSNICGGLVGNAGADSKIAYSYSSVNVYGASSLGGLIGQNLGKVNNSFSTGNVTSISSGKIGGFIGHQQASSVSNCYSTGKVNGGNPMGGFIGGILSSPVETYNFWDINTSGTSTNYGTAVGKTTIQMKTESTFTDWDFTNIWIINTVNNNNYPYFLWQPLSPYGRGNYNFTNDLWYCLVTSDDTTTCAINLTEYSAISSANMSISGIQPSVSDYNSLDRFPESDGVAEYQYHGGFGSSNNNVRNVFIFFKNFSVDTPVIDLEFRTGFTSGEPYNYDIYYDLKVCTTIKDKLTTDDFENDCESSFSIISTNLNMNDLPTDGNYFNITLDNQYTFEDDKKYILKFDVRDALDDGTNRNLYLYSDNNGSNINFTSACLGDPCIGGNEYERDSITYVKMYANNNYPSSPSISIDGSTIWNQSGNFSSTETTSDFSSSLTAGVINYFNITASVWGELSLDTLSIIASSNTASNLTATAISPSTAYTDDTLKFNATCTDADSGDTITAFCQIYNGTATYGSIQSLTIPNGTNKNICNVSNSITSKSEIWKAEMWCGDSTENSSKTNTSTITIQNSVPQITTNSPIDNDHSNQNLTVNYQVTDQDVDLLNCSLVIDGSVNTTNTSLSNGTTTNIIGVLTGGDGNYTWFVSCTDGVATVNSTERNYAFDTINPDITWNYPLADNSTIITNPTFNLNVTINDMFLFRALLNLTNSSGNSMYSNYSGDIDQRWFNFTGFVNMTDLPSGTYTIEASGTDDSTYRHLKNLSKQTKSDTEFFFSDTSNYNGLTIKAEIRGSNNKKKSKPNDFTSRIDDIHILEKLKKDKKKIRDLPLISTELDDLMDKYENISSEENYLTEYKLTYSFTVDGAEDYFIFNLSTVNTKFIKRESKGWTAHFLWGDGYYFHAEDANKVKVNGENVTAKVEVISYTDHEIILKIEPETKLKKGDYIEIDPVVGGTNLITEDATFTYDSDPDITNVNLILIDLLNGSQKYNITYNATDEETNSLTCMVTTQEGDKSLSFNSGQCFGEFQLNQSATNSLIPKASDGHATGQASTLQGLEVAFNQYLADPTQTNTVSNQYFKKQYNLSSNLSNAYIGIQWSLNSSDSIKYVDLPAGTITQNSENSYSSDFISEDSGFTIAGDIFTVDQGYNIYRNLVCNNTLSNKIPNIVLTVPLNYYDASPLAEKQNGILWPDLNSTYNGSHLSFNLSEQNASTSQSYRYSYDASLISWVGENIADYSLSGEYREWTLDRTYYFNFPMSNKTIQTDITTSSLTEWVGKTATWASTLTNNNTGASVAHTTTDHASYASLSFSDANSSDQYEYQLLYYTLSPISGGDTGGGGGGGGGGTTTIIEEVSNETIEKIVDMKLSPSGKIEFYYPGHTQLIPYLPTRDFYKEIIIKAVGGPVKNVSLEFSRNINPYFTGAICDLRENTCYQTTSLEEGEEKYIFVMGNLSYDMFTEHLLTENRVDGYVQLLSKNKAVSNPYNLSLKKAKMFDGTLKVSEKIKFPHKAVYIITVFAIVIIIGITLVSGLKMFGIM